jgi:hypothetical protein
LSREENVEKKRRKVSTSSVHGDLDFIDPPPGVTVIRTICEGPRWPKHKKITATLAASRAAVFLFGPGSQKVSHSPKKALPVEVASHAKDPENGYCNCSIGHNIQKVVFPQKWWIQVKFV